MRVTFDNPTPRGRKSIGVYDSVWFKTHPNGLTKLDTRTIRIHQPFSVPMHWVTGPAKKYTFTEDQAQAGHYTNDDAVRISDELHIALPNAVIAVQ